MPAWGEGDLGEVNWKEEGRKGEGGPGKKGSNGVGKKSRNVLPLQKVKKIHALN